MIHELESPLANKTVTVTSGFFKNHEYRVEDWWDRVTDKSWKVCQGNPACIEYAARSFQDRNPIDDEVLYGKIGIYGKLIHISNLKEIT